MKKIKRSSKILLITYGTFLVLMTALIIYVKVRFMN